MSLKRERSYLERGQTAGSKTTQPGGDDAAAQHGLAVPNLALTGEFIANEPFSCQEAARFRPPGPGADSIWRGTGVPPGKGHGQDAPATSSGVNTHEAVS